MVESNQEPVDQVSLQRFKHQLKESSLGSPESQAAITTGRRVIKEVEKREREKEEDT